MRKFISSPASKNKADGNKAKQALLNIKKYLERHYGIQFDRNKLYSLRHKLKKRLRALNIDGFSEYYQHLQEHKDEVHNFLDVVSTNKTAFFREAKHWQFLRENVFPNWRLKNAPAKAWSVPCSTGEEPYSLSMLADDYFDGQVGGENYPVQILASDVSRSALRKAQNGRYGQRRIRQIKSFNCQYPERYLSSTGNGKYIINNDLKHSLTLRVFNLNEEYYPVEDTFDLIFCRNVLIYFDNDVVQHVINQLTQCLASGGYLFIGHTESLYDIDHNLEKVKPSIFKK